jgi:hypothetical protein
MRVNPTIEGATMIEPQNLDTEAPEADAAEQAVNADPADDSRSGSASSSIEAPEWDAQEQSLEVPLDDDYR